MFGSNKGWLKRDSFDSGYVRRLRDGDAETERHFAAYFGELLLIKLRARLRHPHLIEDLRQETFVRVLTALKSKKGLESPESLGAFVNSVCNNLLFEMYRRDSQHRAIEMDDRFDAPADQASAESEMVNAERCEEVRQVLEELPLKDRELLRMVFYDDVDKAQICRSYRVEREYLRVLVHRAKGRFRERLLRRFADRCQADA
jgi:RNA polymerase sigma-70 factor (ECF subfamily)